MELTIAEVAHAASVTSRTLRHYDRIGLLAPSRVGSNGYRYYNDESLMRLQRILLLRELGIGLSDIRAVLNGRDDEATALNAHLELLRADRKLIDRKIAAVQHTIAAREKGEPIVPEKMFDGFDHSVHRAEVESRWGDKAYADSDRWWRDLGEAGRAEMRADTEALNQAWQDAAAAVLPVDGDDAQNVAERHVRWLTAATGGRRVTAEYLAGLGDMYLADDRFWPNYGGEAGAAYVRDALRVYAERNLGEDGPSS